MSYMRWPMYAWTSSACDETCLLDCVDPDHIRWHLWARGGEEAEATGVNAFDASDGYEPEFTGGIELPGPLFDELVLCRYAELVKSGEVAIVAARVADPESSAHGNFGSWDLLEALGEDPAAEFTAAMEEAKRIRDAREANA